MEAPISAAPVMPGENARAEPAQVDVATVDVPARVPPPEFSGGSCPRSMLGADPLVPRQSLERVDRPTSSESFLLIALAGIGSRIRLAGSD